MDIVIFVVMVAVGLFFMCGSLIRTLRMVPFGLFDIAAIVVTVTWVVYWWKFVY